MTSPPSLPTVPTLQDFEPLLLAELIVLRAAAEGSIAKVGYRRPRNATPDVRLRAEFLAFLAHGGGAGASVAGGRLQVLGACIVGRLSLAHTRVPVSLWLYRCVFASTPVLDGAHFTGSLSLPDTGLPGLQAEGLRVDGELALNAGCSVHGEIQLSRAVIGRDLNLARLQLQPSEKFANTLPCRLLADGARIGGDLRASGAHLNAALDADGARGVALNLDRARVQGHVLLDAGFSAAGQVRLQRARIGGDLDATGADFDAVGDAGWDDDAAVLLDRARIGGTLVLRQLQRPLEGTSLVDARVGALHDDALTWGAHHVLDGFSYKRFASDAPTDATMRLGWLATQRANHFGDDFRPEPWHRVIKVLQRMGRDASAADVAIGHERHLRRHGLIGLDVPAAWRWLPRASHALHGLLAGHGHRPWRLLAVAAAVWLLCGIAYWAAGMPAWRAGAYSLDVLVPLADLRPAPAAAMVSPLLQALSWLEAASGWVLGLTWLAGLIGRRRVRA